jgi:RHS repeat-associated protein
VSAVTYSAFAEPLGDGQSLGRRFRYAGGWGYQADLLVLEGAPGTGPITLIHVGHRWYQPDIGRFIQRDPLGISGGVNVYAYLDNEPVSGADPSGLDRIRTPWGWRDPRTGRWVKGPWWWRGGKWGVRRFPAVTVGYWIGIQMTKGLYRLSGEPYPGDPWPLFKETCVAVWDCLDTSEYPPPRRPSSPEPWPRDPPMFPRGPFFCFVEDTVVYASEGPKSVGELKVGTQVASAGIGSDAGTERVVAVASAWAREIIEVDLGDEVLRCTAQHPFLVSEKGWTRAADLRPGDRVASGTGEPVRVCAARRVLLVHPVRVINISLSERHTYNVGRHRVIVHNKSI